MSNKRKVFPQNDIDNIISLYIEGQSLKSLSKLYNTRSTILKDVLLNNNILIRKKGEQVGKYTYRNKHTYAFIKNYIEVESDSDCKLISEDYIKSSELLLLQCSCGNKFEISFDSFKKRKYKVCSECMQNIQRKYEFNTVKEILYINNYEMINDSEYINAGSSITCKCLVCGNIMKTSLGSIISGRKCGKCAGNKNYTHEEFIDKLNDKYGNEYIVLDKYIKMTNYITIQRTTCGHIFPITPHNLLNHDRGCPICKESHGEKRIRRFLNKNNIHYIRQYKFDDCRNINCLPFDFAIIDDNNNVLLLIEFDGQQHEKPYDFFGGEEVFIKTKINDEIKNNYCINNNIKLLRIPQSKRCSIEIILINELNKLGVNLVA